MQLRNFRMYEIERHNPKSVGKVNYGSNFNVFIDFNGAEMDFCKSYLQYTHLYPSSGTYYTNVDSTDVSLIIGSGETLVTENDYCLAELISKDVLSVGKLNLTIKHLDDKSQLIYTRTFTYTGNDEITVKEIGLLKGLHWYANNSNFKDVLLVRELLDNPVTVASGESFTVSLALEL